VFLRYFDFPKLVGIATDGVCHMIRSKNFMVSLQQNQLARIWDLSNFIGSHGLHYIHLE
jgi:hypothetical protein